MDSAEASSRVPSWLPIPIPSAWVSLAPGLLLAAITAALCWRLLSGQFVVTGYDTLTYFYPYRAYAGEVIRSGQLPHWNPYLFYGVPFLANIQTAVFYPLNALFYLLEPTDCPELVGDSPPLPRQLLCLSVAAP